MLNRRNCGRGSAAAGWMVVAAVMAASSTHVLAQASSNQSGGGSSASPNASPTNAVRQPAKGQPVRRGRVMKPAIVNLEAQAGSRREGQVLPGDPPPEKFAPPAPTVAMPAIPAAVPPAAAAREPELKLESSAPPPPPPVAEPTPAVPPSKPLKAAPTPVDPESGPRPLPRMPEMTRGGPAAHEPDESEATSEPVAAAMDDGVTMEPESATASADSPGAPAMSRTTAAPAPRTPIAAAEPEAPRLEWQGAEVSVVSASERDVQWRVGDAGWNTPGSGSRESGRIEVRTGPEGDAVVNVDGQIAVRIAPLSRVVIERRVGLKLMPSVMLERGSVDLRAQTSEPVESWVRTPDRRAGFPTWPGVRVSYSAFSGTSVQTGAEIAQPR